jgi:hypothetical protein
MIGWRVARSTGKCATPRATFFGRCSAVRGKSNVRCHPATYLFVAPDVEIRSRGVESHRRLKDDRAIGIPSTAPAGFHARERLNCSAGEIYRLEVPVGKKPDGTAIRRPERKRRLFGSRKGLGTRGV